MPKRIGFLYERVVSVENCTAAEAEMAKITEADDVTCDSDEAVG